jgi:PAS domain S-box-containing protein
MLSFRKKILLGDIIVFLIFIALMFPFVERTVNYTVKNSLDRRVLAEIDFLKELNSEGEIIKRIRDERAFVFFRVTLFDGKGHFLYDSLFSGNEEQGRESFEVEKALKSGRGFQNRYSTFFHQAMAYSAIAFDAGGKTYVLRMGIPFGEIRALMVEFEIGFLILGTIFLMLYGIATWTIIHRLSLPIQHIVNVIKPYQEGKDEFIPHIEVNEGGEFGNLAKTLNSMSARIKKQIDILVQQRSETEAILESLGEGVIAVDAEERILFANSSACQMLAAAREGMLRQKFREIKVQRRELMLKCYELIRHSFDQAEVVVETFILDQGRKYYFDLIASPLARHRGIVLVIQDKSSDHKILEMGKDFVANASHELRTPLTIIRGFAETLHDLPNLPKQTLKEISEKILKTSIRLEILVKSLLTLADIEGFNDEQLHRVDLVPVAEGCMQNLLAAHPHAQVVLHRKKEEIFVRANVPLLEMAITNLLENAVRYSPAPAQISITVDEAGDWAQVIVADQGIGIPEGDLPHIFDRFYTIDKARSRKFGGAGLGLSIVKGIVQKHHGEVSAASKLGQGTTFTIQIPKA